MRYDTNDRARSEEMEHLDSLLEENASLRAEVEHWKAARTNALEGGDILKAEVERLREDAHLANGVADLAIKHRDAAEAEVARVTQESNMHARACAKVFDELQEVKRERDQIIERCAEVCLAQRNMRVERHPPRFEVTVDAANIMAEKCAAAIRALKEEK